MFGSGPSGRFALQGSLLAQGEPVPDTTFATARRIELGRGAWVDHQPGWLDGSDDLLAELVTALQWRQRERPMYQQFVVEPRLTAWSALDDPALPPPLQRSGAALADRYGRPPRTVGCNWYRNGSDSVAWHGDRVARPGDALVAIVSLGARRPLLVRPRGGGPSRRFDLGRGDLFVMGGTCQACFEHAVPKVVRAGPRISVTFRD
jgi:alkylated DNA repair dioxygenase AlkB